MKKANSAKTILTIGSLALLSAQQVVAQERDNSRPVWEFGGFGILASQQSYPGSSKQITRFLPLPYFTYRGERFRADRGNIGMQAVETGDFSLDVGFSGSFGTHSNDDEARRGLPDLGTFIEFGPRPKWRLANFEQGLTLGLEAPLRGVFDLSNRFNHRGFTFEPKLTLGGRAFGKLPWQAGFGPLIGDRKINATYYEVAPQFVTADRPAWQAKSGLIAWRLGGFATLPIGPDWGLYFFGRLDNVKGSANADSPLVSRQTGATVGIGFSYTWLRSSERTAASPR